MKVLKICRICCLFLLFTLPMQVIAFQTIFGKDSLSPTFRISLSKNELQGNIPSGMFYKFSPEDIFSVRKMVPGDLENRYSGWVDPASFSWEFAEEAKAIKIELQDYWTTESSKRERMTFCENLISEVEAGKLKIPSEELDQFKKELSDIKIKREELGKRRESLQNRQMELEKLLRERMLAGFSKDFGLSIYGRYRDPGRKVFSLTNRVSGERILEAEIYFPKKTSRWQDSQDLTQGWFLAQDESFSLNGLLSPEESFFSYFRNQVPKILSANLSGNFNNENSRIFFNSQRSVDLFSLTTGALAVQESLQLDRMTNTHLLASETISKIPIRNLAGPQVKSHPFIKMIGSQTPEIEPISNLVPYCFYYLRFSDINSEIRFSDFSDHWGTAILQTLQASSRDSKIRDKLLTQLSLELSDLTKLFGDKVIADLAITGSDPFINEGSDVSVIFSLKQPGIFEMNSQRLFSNTRAKFPEAKEENGKYGDVPIYHLFTSDHIVDSYSCTLDNYKIYSNSGTAIKWIIDSFQTKIESLAKTPDFRYMRTIFPLYNEREDAFLYLSDAHIRRLVSSKSKIGRLRRLICSTNLKMLSNASTMWSYFKGTPGNDINLLQNAKFLGKNYLACPDKGRYSFDASGEPCCSVHGKNRFLSAIIDGVPKFASPVEAKAYRQFVEDYNSYWSKFFDPIGIRFTLRDKEIGAETCILPLVENSIYKELASVGGEKPAEFNFPTHEKTFFQFLGKINFPPMLRNDTFNAVTLSELLGRTSFSTTDVEQTFGESFSVNLVDSPIQFTFDSANSGTFYAPMQLLRQGNFLSVIGGTILLSCLQVPTYGTISLKDENRGEKFISELIEALTKESARHNQSGAPPMDKIIGYCVESGVKGGPTIHTLDITIFIIKFHLHFMVYSGQLFISNQRNILSEILSNPTNVTKTQANFQIRLNCKNRSQIAEKLNILWQERLREVCNSNLGVLNVLNEFRKIPPEKWAEESLKINGFVPLCPEQGTYQLLSDGNTISCTKHGSAENRLQPLISDPKVPINDFISKILGVTSTLDFTPEGIMTKVVINLE
ncbi:MAG: hypothetical protein HQM08_16325 [Candidatus Riflebacteria bacterium]|nr:hypothetical protein [Candidatus Riflebacteria bacterium]